MLLLCDGVGELFHVHQGHRELLPQSPVLLIKATDDTIKVLVTAVLLVQLAAESVTEVDGPLECRPQCAAGVEGLCGSVTCLKVTIGG